MLSSNALLQQILEQSNTLYELILNGELEEAERIEEERGCLIRCCFSSESLFDNPQQAAEMIQKIIDSDKKAMAHGQQLYGDMKRDLARLQQGNKAVRAYQEAGA